MASLGSNQHHLPKTTSIFAKNVEIPSRGNGQALRAQFLEEERKLYDVRSEQECPEPLIKLGVKYWGIHRIILNPYVYPITTLIDKPPMQEVKSANGATGVIPNVPSLCQFIGFRVPKTLAENLVLAFPDEYILLK